MATGLDIQASILVLAAAATFYTLFGGIKGVIWTEVMQATVLVSGALILVWSLLGNIPLGFSEVVGEIAAADPKLRCTQRGRARGCVVIAPGDTIRRRWAARSVGCCCKVVGAWPAS